MRLFLANHDGRFQMDMDDDQKLLVTWLEEEMLDVAEEYVCVHNVN